MQSRFPTLAFFRSVRKTPTLKLGSLVFLIEDLKYEAEDPMRYGVLITRNFDVNHGSYYHLSEKYIYDNRYQLVVDSDYDMTEKASMHRTFVGVSDIIISEMNKFIKSHVPSYGAKLSERPKRPSLNEEEDMTDEKFLSDYRGVKKGQRDSERELKKYEKLDRLEEEYRDRLPKEGSDPVTLEYIHKKQEIEDEYLNSLELPERGVVESRPVEDDEFWDELGSSMPEKGFEDNYLDGLELLEQDGEASGPLETHEFSNSRDPSTPAEEDYDLQRAKNMDDNWTHQVVVEAIRENYIRPGEEFHVFAL